MQCYAILINIYLYNIDMPSVEPLSSITRLNATVKDLLIYLFDFSPMDSEVLFTLMKKNQSLTVDELAKKLKRDRTTVFRIPSEIGKGRLLLTR